MSECPILRVKKEEPLSAIEKFKNMIHKCVIFMKHFVNLSVKCSCKLSVCNLFGITSIVDA